LSLRRLRRICRSSGRRARASGSKPLPVRWTLRLTGGLCLAILVILCRSGGRLLRSCSPSGRRSRDAGSRQLVGTRPATETLPARTVGGGSGSRNRLSLLRGLGTLRGNRLPRCVRGSGLRCHGRALAIVQRIFCRSLRAGVCRAGRGASRGGLLGLNWAAFEPSTGAGGGGPGGVRAGPGCPAILDRLARVVI